MQLNSRILLCSIGMSLLLSWQFAFANVVGSDAQNFNPTPDGLDFVTVQSSSTLERGIYNLGLFTNYAKNPLPYYESDASGGAKRGSWLIGGDLDLGIGLARGWDAGLNLPFILGQGVDSDSAVGHYSSTGNTEIRVGTKYRFWGTQRTGVAMVASANFNRIKDDPYVGDGGGPIYNLELAYKHSIKLAAWALNVGYRWRSPGTPVEGTGIEPLGNQWLASAAMNYRLNFIDSKVVFEVFGAMPSHAQISNSTDRENSVLEALLGLKYDTSNHVSFNLGGGAGLIRGISSPDYRVYAGFNIAFGTFGKRHSLAKDPYASRQKKTREPKIDYPIAGQTQTSPNLPQPVSSPPSPEETNLEPPPASAALTTTKTTVAPPTKTLPPTSEPRTSPTPVTNPTPDAAEIASQEVPAAVSSETIRDVHVFNRGTFNHIVLHNIEFEANTMALKPESQAYLMNELVPVLRELNHRRPISTIVVEGHTDSLGNKAYNQMLSQARAQIVGVLLQQNLGLKIPVHTEGRGSADPIADNGNYQGRAQNRRVEIKLLYRRSSH